MGHVTWPRPFLGWFIHFYSVLEVFFIYGTLNLTFTLHYITLHYIIIRGLRLAAINLSTKLELCISISIHYKDKDMKGDTEREKCGGLG